jgi:hypothetical protein
MCVRERAILALGSVSIPEENGWFWTTFTVPMQALLKEAERLRGVLLEIMNSNASLDYKPGSRGRVRVRRRAIQRCRGGPNYY